MLPWWRWPESNRRLNRYPCISTVSEIFICSDVEINLNKNLSKPTINVQVELASGGKCLRCWKVVNEVKDDIEVCYRCTSVLQK